MRRCVSVLLLSSFTGRASLVWEPTPGQSSPRLKRRLPTPQSTPWPPDAWSAAPWVGRPLPFLAGRPVCAAAVAALSVSAGAPCLDVAVLKPTQSLWRWKQPFWRQKTTVCGTFLLWENIQSEADRLTADCALWPVRTEGTGRTDLPRGWSASRTAGPLGCGRGGGASWPCHTHSPTPRPLDATQSAKRKQKLGLKWSQSAVVRLDFYRIL